jgi:hypothetical protein
MGEMAEDFRLQDEYYKKRRADRYKKNLIYIKQIKGYVITEVTPYQFRFYAESIGDFCDLYPTNQRFHNLITNQRGHYKTAQGFLDMQVKKAKEKLNDA